MEQKTHAKDGACNGYPIVQRFDLVATNGYGPACLEPGRRDAGVDTPASGDCGFINGGRIDVTDEGLLLGLPP